jgi:hypothetical protein
MTYLNIYDDKTCHNKINNIFINFLNKNVIPKVNKCLQLVRE